MKANVSKNNNGRGLYIALAICILAIIGIGVYSAVMNVFQAPEYNSPVPNSTASSQKPPATTKAPALVPSKTDTPPATTVAAKPTDKEDISVSVIDPAKRVYTKPVNGSVIKEYSDDVLVYSVTMNDYRVHSGVDIAASLGNPVMAFCDGVIKEITEDPLMGYTVSVDHGGGLVSVYQNLSAIVPQGIEVGVNVKSGDVLAGVGESALVECAESPHLHFEVWLNGVAVNPSDYLELG